MISRSSSGSGGHASSLSAWYVDHAKKGVKVGAKNHGECPTLRRIPRGPSEAVFRPVRIRGRPTRLTKRWDTGNSLVIPLLRAAPL